MVMAQKNLDMDVLRTFVTGIELGSFARAAGRLGRSQSALSNQLRKLEEQVGQPLVERAGRGLVPTQAGESLIGYARRILELNDEVLERLRGEAVEGSVRLGLSQDFAEDWLPVVLGRFARAHPKVRIQVRVERHGRLVERTLRGELDVALAWGDATASPDGEQLALMPVRWIGRPGWSAGRSREPLPLVAFDPPCLFRTLSVDALDQAGRAWRLAFSSPSLAGLWAAIGAGLGVGARTTIGLTRGLVPLDAGAAALPELPAVPLTLHTAEAHPAAPAARLSTILREAVRAHVGGGELAAA